MKLKKSKFRNDCGWFGLACSIFFFIGLGAFVLLNVGCVILNREEPINPRPYDTPDMVTDAGVQVWTGGHDVDPDEIDLIFEEVVEYLSYEYDEVPLFDEVPPFDLVIGPSHCREYPNGLTYCGFEDPDLDFMLAGRFYYIDQKPVVKIHIMNGEWTLDRSALDHEIEHYVMYIYNIPGWNINEVELTEAESIE